jgi:polyhydroxyalkanoate synthesis regulator phasin
MLVIILSFAAVRADQTDKLINILIEKGIITSEEAKSLEKEVKGEVVEKEVKKEASAGDDWPKKIEVAY